MSIREIIPAVTKYIQHLSSCINEYKKASSDPKKGVMDRMLEKLVGILEEIDIATTELKETMANIPQKNQGGEIISLYCKNKIIPSMNKLRKSADIAQMNTAEEFWPFPDNSKLLLSV